MLPSIRDGELSTRASDVRRHHRNSRASSPFWLAATALGALLTAAGAYSQSQVSDSRPVQEPPAVPSHENHAPPASSDMPEEATPAAFDGTAGRAFIERNCLNCHNERDEAGKLNLVNADPDNVSVNLTLWETVARRVRGGEMPPSDARRKPSPQEAAVFSHWLVGSLNQYSLGNPDPGHPVMRRLNRAEYLNSVRDLLGLEVNVRELLPPDAPVGGFTTNAQALSMSPLALEKYLGVARQVTRQAVGDPSLPRTIYEFAIPDDQMTWLPGLPFGARGGVSADHYFPISGEYIIRAITDRPSKLPATENHRRFEVRANIPAGGHKVVVSVAEELALPEGTVTNIRSEGAPATPGPIDPMMSLGNWPFLDVRVGGKRLGFIKIQPPTLSDLNTQNGLLPGQVFINRIEVDGPFNAKGPGLTESRRRIFTCTPKTAREEPACAEKILSSITRRAFRRDITAGDIAPFMGIFTRVRGQASFEQAIQESLQAVLVAPDFLFRIESTPSGVKPASIYRIDDFALASRLSFFLWSSIPDDELLDLARTGQLHQPEVLEAQTRRMLRDPRAQALVDNFGMEYLGLTENDHIFPDAGIYPGFTNILKGQFREETRLFLRDLFTRNRSVTELVDARHTYLNESLARHYGINSIYGAQFRKVSFAQDDIRGGILGQGSVLLATSHPNETSSVLRGKWVLTNLLNSPLPPPPPDVPTLIATNEDGKKLTGREQMEQHRINPSCSSCHARMDPYGFAMENMNVVGRWRDKEDGGPIDAAVAMPDGSTFKGIVGLRNQLANQQRDLAEAFAARMFSYALGRQLQGYDWPVVRLQVVDKAPGYRFEDIVLGIVRSSSFQMKRAQEAS